MYSSLYLPPSFPPPLPPPLPSRYFKTGDLGRFVKGGLGVPLLKITGRVKELYKLENGREGGGEGGREGGREGENGRSYIAEIVKEKRDGERRGGREGGREGANLSTPLS